MGDIASTVARSDLRLERSQVMSGNSLVPDCYRIAVVSKTHGTHPILFRPMLQTPTWIFTETLPVIRG